MNDPTIALMQDLIIAETSEPMFLTDPPQRSKHALLYRRALDGLRNLKRRIHDLLEANVRYERRARSSEELLFKLYETHTMKTSVSEDLMQQIDEHLQEPWRLSMPLGADSQPE